MQQASSKRWSFSSLTKKLKSLFSLKATTNYVSEADKFNVVLIADANYFQFTIVCLMSFVKYAGDIKKYHFHLHYIGFSERQKQALEKFITDHHLSLTVYDASVDLEKISLQVFEGMSPAVYLRFFIPKWFNEQVTAQLRKDPAKPFNVLFIDPDVFVFNDLSHLATLDMKDCLWGAVTDSWIYHKLLKGFAKDYPHHVGKTYEEVLKYNDWNHEYLNDVLRVCGTDPEKFIYFNAGVMVWNLRALAQKNIDSNTIFNFAKEQPALRYMDQDYLNLFAHQHGKVYWLDSTYNYFHGKLDYGLNFEHKEGLVVDGKEIKIVHCFGPHKPFLTKYTPLREEYIRLLASSGVPLNL